MNFIGRISRRHFLAGAAGMLALTALDRLRWPLVWADPSNTDALIVRVERPLDAETPPAALTSLLTPNDRFFVRSHFGPPAPETVAADRWHLTIGGLVDRPLSFSLDDLKQFESVELTAVLQCSGNGRAFYRPRVPGAQWERGAVGNARWRGVRLADVLARAGVQHAAAHVEVLGADRPMLPTVPLFRRSIPLAKALHPDTLLATHMNGEPLPILHGAPMRLIAPGWMGDVCVKWLTEITVRDQESTGYYMEQAYRYPRKPVAPGGTAPAQEMEPVTVMNVKSLVTGPRAGAMVTGRELIVHGVAWTGEGRVTRVDVSLDQGTTWRPAALTGPDERYGWRAWRCDCAWADAGSVEIWSRAADDRGAVQPISPPWNPGGFLWNGVDRVRVEATRK